MHIRIVSLHVKPDQIEAFKQVSLIDAQKAVTEPGVISFAFLQQADDPTHFVLVEVYRSDEARTRHFETEWFHTWREAVTPMFAKPLESVQYTPVFPLEADWQ